MAQSKANSALHKPPTRDAKPTFLAARCVVESLEFRRLLSAAINTLFSFNGADGNDPKGGLIADPSGDLFGTASDGGPHAGGVLFELSGAGDQTFTNLASFAASSPSASSATGISPLDTLYSDGQGDLFGTAWLNGPVFTQSEGTVFEWSPSDGQTPQGIHAFDGDDGQGPEAGLVADSLGNLFGTTAYGGDTFTGGGASGDGTVFELAAPDYTTLTTLVNFNGSNGLTPYDTLYIDSQGNFFGTTAFGGADNDGTVFELSGPNYQNLTTLATFNLVNGQNPMGGLIADSDGNLYGTTFNGGDLNVNSGRGYGTVFELSGPDHQTLTTLATFNGDNGESPESDLLMDAAGSLYGVAPYGGNLSLNAGTGFGTVYEVAVNSDTLSTLLTFNQADGQAPFGTLIADAAGNLYGTTSGGGASGSGTVFELTGAGFIPDNFAALSNGILTVNGTDGDDTITLTSDGNNVTAALDGTASQPFPLSSITSITVNGLDGNDLITVEPSMPSSLGVSVQGGPGDDTITGGPGNDTLGGGAGNDSILGGPGDDSIKGGQNDDILAGGQGNDTLFGSLGNDTLRGALGDDSLNGGAGFNQMTGGQGNNTFYAVNGTNDELFAGAATNDFLIYSAGDSPIVETGIIPAGNQTLMG